MTKTADSALKKILIPAALTAGALYGLSTQFNSAEDNNNAITVYSPDAFLNQLRILFSDSLFDSWLAELSRMTLAGLIASSSKYALPLALTLLAKPSHGCITPLMGDMTIEAIDELRLEFETNSTFTANLPPYLSLTSNYGIDTPGEAWAVVLDENDIAYVADGNSVQYIDTNKPEQEPFHNVPVNGTAVAIAKQGDYLYVIDGNLQIIKGGKVVKTFDSQNSAVSLAVQNNFLVIANGPNGGIVLDISNSEDPQELFRFSSPGKVREAVIQGDYFYVTTGQGLEIYDMSNRSNILLAGRFQTSSKARRIDIQDNVVFMSTVEGIARIDVTDKKNPREIGNVFPLDVYFYGLKATGNILNVAAYGDGFFRLDISDLKSLKILSQYKIPSYTGGLAIKEKTKEIILAASNYGLQFVNLLKGVVYGTPTESQIGNTDQIIIKSTFHEQPCNNTFQITPTRLPQLNNPPVGASVFPGRALKHTVGGMFRHPKKAFLKLTADLPKWANLVCEPIQLNSIKTTDGNYAVAIQNKQLFFGDKNKLKIFDVADYSSPKENIVFTANGNIKSIALQDNIIVAAHDNGIDIFDKTKPANQALIKTFATGKVFNKVKIVGNTLLAFGEKIIQTYSLNMLALHASQELAERAWGGDLKNDKIYVATDTGLKIYDLDLKQIGAYDTSNFVFDVAVDGTTAHVTVGNQGLVILDVSKDTPTFLGKLSVQSDMTKLTLKDKIATIAYDDGGVLYVDVSNPKEPKIIGQYNTPGLARGIATDGAITVVGDSTSVQILDAQYWNLEGTPGKNDVGNVDVKITATGPDNGKITASPFTIRVESPPIIKGQIPRKIAQVGETHAGFVPSNVVSDPNGDAMTFSEDKQDWVQVNPSGSVLGTPSAKDVGTLRKKILVTDNKPDINGKQTTQEIIYEVYVNTKPVQYQPLPSMAARENQLFNKTIDLTKYVKDADKNKLSYAVENKPAWLNVSFDDDSMQLTGTPSTNDVGTFTLSIMFEDEFQGKGTADMNFEVKTEVAPAIIGPTPPFANVIIGQPYEQLINFKNIFSGFGKLNYAVSGLPKGLTFEPTNDPDTFSVKGEVGTSAAEFYNDREYDVRFKAIEGAFATESIAKIKVTGQTLGKNFVKYGGYAASGVTAALAFKRNYALIRNTFKDLCKKNQAELKLGNIKDGLTFVSLREHGSKLVTYKVNEGKSWYQLWKFKNIPLSSGSLPYWLKFTSTTTLDFAKGGPVSDDAGLYLFQTLSASGVVLEEKFVRFGKNDIESPQYDSEYSTYDMSSEIFTESTDTSPMSVGSEVRFDLTRHLQEYDSPKSR